MNVASIYGMAAMTFFGPAMIAGAIIGYAVHRKSARKGRGAQKRAFVYILCCSIHYNLHSITIWLRRMNEWWFNSRFLIMLSTLLILLLSILVANSICTSSK
jgi:hypothetical protein